MLLPELLIYMMTAKGHLKVQNSCFHTLDKRIKEAKERKAVNCSRAKLFHVILLQMFLNIS